MGDILMSEMKDLKIRRKRILNGTGCRVSYKIGRKIVLETGIKVYIVFFLPEFPGEWIHIMNW